jgi:hypothetical protein
MKQAMKLKVTMHTITFDQLLWLKAVNTADLYKLKIVCRLPYFNEFPRKFGTLMAGTGISNLMGRCYGVNTNTVA